MKLTEKRREWLQRLADHGPAKSGTKVGYYCRSAGWSEWLLMTKGGQEMTFREFTKKVNEGELDWDAIIPNGDLECITDAGRLALSGGSDDTR